jgi:hypothetical protein
MPGFCPEWPHGSYPFRPRPTPAYVPVRFLHRIGASHFPSPGRPGEATLFVRGDYGGLMTEESRRKALKAVRAWRSEMEETRRHIKRNSKKWEGIVRRRVGGLASAEKWCRMKVDYLEESKGQIDRALALASHLESTGGKTGSLGRTVAKEYEIQDTLRIQFDALAATVAKARKDLEQLSVEEHDSRVRIVDAWYKWYDAMLAGSDDLPDSDGKTASV